MKIPSNGKLLRIFIGERDVWQSQPLYEALIHDPEMSRFPFQQSLYPGFNIREYLSREKDMQSSVVIARRRKSFSSVLASLLALF